MLISFRHKVVFLFFVLTTTIAAESVIDLKKSKKQYRGEYRKLQKQFAKQVCSNGAEQKYWKLSRKYRKNKYHLPVLLDGSLDHHVIKEHLPMLTEKSKWITRNIRLLKKAKITSIRKEIRKLKRDLEKLLKYKQDYFDNKGDKKKLELKSKKDRIRLATKFSSLLRKVPFLLSFHFPVNHLGFRQRYDSLKYLQSQEHKQQANSIYFYRKIVEDGAQSPTQKYNDIFLRTTIDTVYLGLNRNIDFITENLRHDLGFVLDGIDLHVRKGKKRMRKRLFEWRSRVRRKKKYYSSLIKNNSGDAILIARRGAHSKLKSFVLKKQEKTYSFWSKQSEIMQALFSLETILFNEVGGIDGRDALERKDIAQVVINRRFMKKYTNLSSKDSIYPYISKSDSINDINLPWLNVMFKEGEFSFTYFFIPSTVRIFCPAMTRRARRLRTQNVSIAFDLLKKPNSKFDATRYFSRSSMLGRIDMASIWKDYLPVPERAGTSIKRAGKLKRRYRKGHYSYRYHFSDDANQLYKVISINRRNYVLLPSTQEFFKYRSPHVFRYFSAID